MLMLVNSVRDEKLSEYLNMHINRPELLEDLLQVGPGLLALNPYHAGFKGAAQATRASI